MRERERERERGNRQKERTYLELRMLLKQKAITLDKSLIQNLYRNNLRLTSSICY